MSNKGISNVQGKRDPPLTPPGRGIVCRSRLVSGGRGISFGFTAVRRRVVLLLRAAEHVDDLLLDGLELVELELRVPDQERLAGASDYTHIRWSLDAALTPKESGHVGFRAQLQ